MIPFPLVSEKPTNSSDSMVSHTFTSEQSLLPGQNRELDFIVDMILDKTTYTDRIRNFIL